MKNNRRRLMMAENQPIPPIEGRYPDISYTSSGLGTGINGTYATTPIPNAPNVFDGDINSFTAISGDGNVSGEETNIFVFNTVDYLVIDELTLSIDMVTSGTGKSLDYILTTSDTFNPSDTDANDEQFNTAVFNTTGKQSIVIPESVNILTPGNRFIFSIETGSDKAFDADLYEVYISGWTLVSGTTADPTISNQVATPTEVEFRVTNTDEYRPLVSAWIEGDGRNRGNSEIQLRTFPSNNVAIFNFGSGWTPAAEITMKCESQVPGKTVSNIVSSVHTIT